MDSIRFGRTGLLTSRFCLGTMGMGSSAWKGWVKDPDEARPLLKAALDAGINFYDMADWYSPPGLNESLVARTLLDWVPRDHLVLCTKVYYPISAEMNDQGLGRKHILASIDRSLKAMGTDHVDIYMAHGFDIHTPIEETMEAFNDVVRSGKARYLGASTMMSWQFARMNAIAERHGWARFINMQLQYSLLYREEEREMLPLCRQDGIAVSSFSPLARGFLAATETARATHDPWLSAYFGDPVDQEIRRRVWDLAGQRGVSPVSIATAWVLGSAGITCPIIGAESVEQLQHYLQAARVALTDEERAWLEAPYVTCDPIHDHAPPRRPRWRPNP